MRTSSGEMLLKGPLPPLRNGWTECQNVAGALKSLRVDMLLDSEALRLHPTERYFRATPEEFKARADRVSFIHVVAHGLFDKNQPMHSKVFLDAGRTVDAADLADLDLTGVELATFASCETGISGAEPGAEPLGFLRGVLGAGAANVLLASWEVDDNTTAQLLSDFYDRLQHDRRSEALRAAQQKIQSHFHHPYYWVGLSLYGYWN